MRVDLHDWPQGAVVGESADLPPLSVRAHYVLPGLPNKRCWSPLLLLLLLLWVMLLTDWACGAELTRQTRRGGEGEGRRAEDGKELQVNLGCRALESYKLLA